jgi:polysaccharide deacetylase 2 family uncharacterized protein YibQ
MARVARILGYAFGLCLLMYGTGSLITHSMMDRYDRRMQVKEIIRDVLAENTHETTEVIDQRIEAALKEAGINGSVMVTRDLQSVTVRIPGVVISRRAYN